MQHIGYQGKKLLLIGYQGKKLLLIGYHWLPGEEAIAQQPASKKAKHNKTRKDEQVRGALFRGLVFSDGDLPY